MLKHLTSMKTALLIMILIIISSIVATFFPQMHIYQSLWYRGLLLFLCLSLLFCTTKSLSGIIKKIHNPPQTFLNNFDPNKSYSIKKPAFATQALIDFFKENGYKIYSLNNKQKNIISFEKGILNWLAPHILHISLIIVLFGAFMYTFGENANIACYVGKSVNLPDKLLPGVSLQIDDFTTLYDDKGHIDNWQSKITLLNQEQFLTSGKILVNQPFNYRGVKFYQFDYGFDYWIKVTGENTGDYRLPEKKTFQLAGQKFLIIQDHYSLIMNTYDGIKEEAIPLKEGTIINFPNNTKVEYKQVLPYTVLNVKRNPGGKVVMFGLIVVIFSSLLFWTPKYRKLNIFIDQQQNNLYWQIICKDKNLIYTLNQQIKQIIGR